MNFSPYTGNTPWMAMYRCIAQYELSVIKLIVWKCDKDLTQNK